MALSFLKFLGISSGFLGVFFIFSQGLLEIFLVILKLSKIGFSQFFPCFLFCGFCCFLRF